MYEYTSGCVKMLVDSRVVCLKLKYKTNNNMCNNNVKKCT